MAKLQVVDEERVYVGALEGVRLRIACWARGTYDAGCVEPVDEAYPPEEDVELEVTRVEVLAFGQALDVTRQYLEPGSQELKNAVEEGISAYHEIMN